MNKTCSNCYQSNPPEAAFCLNCAAALPKAQYSDRGGWEAHQPNYGVKPNFMNPVGYTAEASSRAKWACALGVLGIFCLGIFASVPAIFVGWAELNAIKQGQSSPSGKAMASFGLWAGVGNTIIQMAAVFIFFLLVLMEAASSPYHY
jgi:hypothetical protein